MITAWWCIEISKALMPFVLAGFGAWIAWQQMQTGKRKLRLDLFDRRFESYKFFNDFAYDLLAFPNSVKLEAMWASFDEMQESASLLFGEKVFVLLDALNKTASEVHRLKDNDAGKVEVELFEAAHNAVRAAMEKFLRFSDVW